MKTIELPRIMDILFSFCFVNLAAMDGVLCFTMREEVKVLGTN